MNETLNLIYLSHSSQDSQHFRFATNMVRLKIVTKVNKQILPNKMVKINMGSIPILFPLSFLISVTVGLPLTYYEYIIMHKYFMHNMSRLIIHMTAI